MIEGIQQGLLVKENAKDCLEALTEIYEALPKKKWPDYLGHLNDVSLFLDRAAKELPSAADKKNLPSAGTGDEALQNLANLILRNTESGDLAEANEMAKQLATLVLQIKYAVFK